jgi:glyceraldehyde 3-phosphate dehydrogenase
VVIESTGRFTNRTEAAAHLEAGAERVVISAPATGADATFVMGVNDQEYDPARHQVVSNASCTTNCFVPMVKVIDDTFGIEAGMMTTVHAMTNDQNLLDLAHRDPRRARAAPLNIVPASTGAARAIGLVMPKMAGKLAGMSMRVPVGDGSITDFTALVSGSVGLDDLNAAFRKASESGPLSPYLDYTSDPIVSSDIVGNPASCIFDSGLTIAVPAGASTLVKVAGWYDNEWGYANRLVDLVVLLGGK